MYTWIPRDDLEVQGTKSKVHKPTGSGIQNLGLEARGTVSLDTYYMYLYCTPVAPRGNYIHENLQVDGLFSPRNETPAADETMALSLRVQGPK